MYLAIIHGIVLFYSFLPILPKRQVTLPPLLTIQQITKTYPGTDKPAIKALSFTIQPGQILGFLGPNGAGKTTAISIISTLLAPSSGTLSLNGQNYQSQAKEVRQNIGLIPQDIALYPKLTGRENLDYFASLHGLPKSKRQQRVKKCLAFSQLTGVANHQINTYSGGMKRRLNMAVALLHEPRLLLLDEPTVGIDAQSRQLILDNLKGLAQQGTALLYTSHYMDEIEQLCDTVLILDQGQVIISGNPQQLVHQHNKQNLRELYISLTGRDLREGQL